MINPWDGTLEQIEVGQCEEMELEWYGVVHWQQAIVAIENWRDKYWVRLRDVGAKRDAAAKCLNKFLEGLGYA